MDIEIVTKQVNLMMVMQNAINFKIDEDWMTRGRPWYRAIWVECGEMMEHIGYKWWKAPELDLAQVQLEIVDIWHFGLSMMVEGGIEADVISSRMKQALKRCEEVQEVSDWSPGLLSRTELFARQVLEPGSRGLFPLQAFTEMMYAANLSTDDLFKMYTAKNVLNTFRQDHGYKTGDYVKIWFGEEDNVHLDRIAKKLDLGDPNYAKALYEKLSHTYLMCVTHDNEMPGACEGCDT